MHSPYSKEEWKAQNCSSTAFTLVRALHASMRGSVQFPVHPGHEHTQATDAELMLCICGVRAAIRQAGWLEPGVAEL